MVPVKLQECALSKKMPILVLFIKRIVSPDYMVLGCFVHVCFVQVTILNIVWRLDAPRCAHFSTDICCVLQEGVITVEKCAHCHLDETNMEIITVRRNQW